MPNPSSSEIERLRAAYAAFNARDIDAALATMTPDVAWPRAFKGGFVEGHEAVRAYWTEQWGEIDPHVEPVAFHAEEAGRILVEVHQVVRDLAETSWLTSRWDIVSPWRKARSKRWKSVRFLEARQRFRPMSIRRPGVSV